VKGIPCSIAYPSRLALFLSGCWTFGTGLGEPKHLIQLAGRRGSTRASSSERRSFHVYEIVGNVGSRGP